MRKVDLEMIRAIREFRPFSKGNRLVKFVYNEETNETIPEVYFHGHRIACFVSQTMQINNCGYYTATTKSILSTLLWEFCRAHLYQKNFDWFVSQEDSIREYIGGDMLVSIV